MIYSIREIQTDQRIQKTAGIKARDDADAILTSAGVQRIDIPSSGERHKKSGKIQKIKVHFSVLPVWKEKLSILRPGDTIVVQFPIMEHSIFLYHQFRRLKKRGISVVLLIHDLELLRAAKRSNTSVLKKLRIVLEEKQILKNCSRIIAHNPKMIQCMCDLGIPKEKQVSLDLFDYLIPEFNCGKMESRAIGKDLPVIIAGNLRPHKSGYVYKLHGCYRFHLFGVGYEGESDEEIRYFGSFPPDELPYALSGSFGLVWDGEEVKTCRGVYGEYLKINNPHKVSLYLASGIPVIIWKQAALADYVVKHRCGIAVDSLDEIPDAIRTMSAETYMEYRANAAQIGENLRGGYYLKQALSACISQDRS